MKTKLSIHDEIINRILSCNVNIIDQSYDVYLDSLHDYLFANIIQIYTCHDEIHWIKEGKQNFAAKCYIDIERVLQEFKINGNFVDAYGSIIIGDELILNNYDASFIEDTLNPFGFVNILGFASIHNNVARFTQIVYSFKFKKLIIRDDVSYTLPFIANIETDFGGKRATYRYGNILSLRTNLQVYKKIPDKYKQSDNCKDQLSYPRLILQG